MRMYFHINKNTYETIFSFQNIEWLNNLVKIIWEYNVTKYFSDLDGYNILQLLKCHVLFNYY